MRGLSRRRIRAIVRKELRVYRRNGSIIAAMAIIPLLFLVQPLVSVLTVSSSSAVQLRDHHELVYMLGIPALVPVMLAAYAVVGERQEGTLEPVLTTPIPREELLLGKALAVLAPSVGIAYAVFGVFLVLVGLFAHPGVPSALIRPPDVVVQVIFTPLIAAWSIWIGIAISTRASDVRVAQQLSVLASLPTLALTTLVAFNVIHATLGLAVGLGVALLLANRLGWRLVSALFDRERLIAGVR
ncbi:MAG TPA: ABC transporter permease subunit [Solirubrobacteraceae bacterium]|nr:ABC transporter permease subunit [Solirubrobacteraceae bacterium]